MLIIKMIKKWTNEKSISNINNKKNKKILQKKNSNINNINNLNEIGSNKKFCKKIDKINGNIQLNVELKNENIKNIKKLIKLTIIIIQRIK